MLEQISVILLIVGLFFGLTGAVGFIKMPDFFTRMHPAGKSETLAQCLILTALMLNSIGMENFGWQPAVKLFFIMVALFVTAPTATHAVAKAAHLEKVTVRKEGQSHNE